MTVGVAEGVGEGGSVEKMVAVAVAIAVAVGIGVEVAPSAWLTIGRWMTSSASTKEHPPSARIATAKIMGIAHREIFVCILTAPVYAVVDAVGD